MLGILEAPKSRFGEPKYLALALSENNAA